MKMPPPPVYDRVPTSPLAAAPVVDRYEVEYRIRRALMCAYAGAPFNHPNPEQRAGRIGKATVDALVDAVVDEVERIVRGERAIESREPKDDEYLPDGSDAAALFPATKGDRS